MEAAEADKREEAEADVNAEEAVEAGKREEEEEEVNASVAEEKEYLGAEELKEATVSFPCTFGSRAGLRR